MKLDFCVSHNYTQRDLPLLPPSLLLLFIPLPHPPPPLPLHPPHPSLPPSSSYLLTLFILLPATLLLLLILLPATLLLLLLPLCMYIHCFSELRRIILE